MLVSLQYSPFSPVCGILHSVSAWNDPTESYRSRLSQLISSGRKGTMRDESVPNWGQRWTWTPDTERPRPFPTLETNREREENATDKVCTDMAYERQTKQTFYAC